MTIQTTASAQTTLDLYLAAEARLAGGKSFTFATENGTRTVTEQDLPEVRKEITRLTRIVNNPGNVQHNVLVANFNHSK